MSQIPAFAHNPVARCRCRRPPARVPVGRNPVERQSMSLADQERWLRVQAAAARRGRRGNLQELVRRDGHRRRRRRHRAALGADPLPQELGAVALCRQAARLLEGGAARGSSHRSGPSLRGAAQRHRQGEAERAGGSRARDQERRAPSAAKRAPRSFRRRPHTRRSAARRSIRGSCSTPSWSAAPTRSRMRRRSRSRWRGAASR